MSDNNWFVWNQSYGGFTTEQLHHETDHRLYYGEPQKSWRGKPGQRRYIEKSAAVARDLSEDVARKIVAIGNDYADRMKSKTREHTGAMVELRAECNREFTALAKPAVQS